MDNRTGEIEAFLRSVDAGSFAAAALQLRQTPSAVSRAVARLESRLGVRLLQRSTRALTLTPEGEAYRQRAQSILHDLDELEASFTADRAEPRGRLRLNTSVPFGLHRVLPVLPQFLQRYPKVTVDISLNDALVNLVDERTDIAIRHGPLRDSSLRARRLGSSRWIIAASPDYLVRHGTPKQPADLESHNCLNFNFRRAIEGWSFRVDGALQQRQVSGNFYGNSGEALRIMAVGGAGIVRLAHFLLAADIAAGRLLPILGSCHDGDTEDIHALYLGQGRPSARVRAMLDFLVEQASVTE